MFWGMMSIVAEPKKIFWLAGVFSALILATFFIYTFHLQNKKRIVFLLFSLLFVCSVFSFLVFLQSGIIKNIFIIFASFFCGFLVYLGRHYPPSVFFEIPILVVAFLIYTSLFGFYILLDIPIGLFHLGILMSSFLLVFLFFYYAEIFRKDKIWSVSNRENFLSSQKMRAVDECQKVQNAATNSASNLSFEKRVWLFIFCFNLIQLEASWALSFWPTSFVSRAVVLFSIFYVATGISKHHLKSTLTQKILREYLIVGIIVLVLVLGTCRWKY